MFLMNNSQYIFKIWLLVFFYILIVGFLFQLVILPRYLPSWHAGDGLTGEGDWIGFHRAAVELAAEMEVDGWNVWELRPGEQAPAGIAAAIYKLTGIAKPWILLPLNALVHAFSAIILMHIIKKISNQSTYQLLAILPFIFFPTALLWNTQFHKDGLFILGSYLFLYGFLLLTAGDNQEKLLFLFKGFILIISGVFFVWVVRPYGVEMILYIGLLLAVLATINLLVKLKINKGLFYRIVMIWLAFALVFPLTATGSHHQYVVVEYQELPSQIEEVDFTDDIDSINLGPSAWRQSSLLPTIVDSIFYRMAVLREQYLAHKPEAGSNIDLHVRFSSAADVIRYLPRALQIGLLAPFPNQWFASGTNFSSTLMRQVSALEMAVSYIAMLGLLAGIWLWRRKVNLYLTMIFAVGMILTYSMVVVNLGTLYRMRFGFMMILVALGITALQELWRTRKLVTRE